MKILFVGDTPTVSTGFASCTRAAAAAMHAAGHDVTVLGISEYGDPRDATAYPYAIYPCRNPLEDGRDAHGVTRLPLLVDRLRPDLIVLLNDPWNIAAYFAALDAYFKDEPTVVPPIVAWLAVDSRNQHAKPLNRCSHVIVWTQFAYDEIRAGGYTGEMSIVPLGVDRTFSPRDQRTARDAVRLPRDSFIVGAVGRNQHRKRLDLTLAAFHEWITNYPARDAVLYLHVAPTGDVGCDIRALAAYYGIEDRVFLTEPHIGFGAAHDHMPNVYSAMDVYLSTSQAEGWGLPALEAMACGVPCILPDFAAYGAHGWPGTAAMRVPCSSTALTAPMNALAYTLGAPPDQLGVVRALDALYTSQSLRRDYAKHGMDLAARLDLDETGRQMRQALEHVHASYHAITAPAVTV